MLKHIANRKYFKVNLETIQKAKQNVRSAQTAIYNEYKSYWYSICLRYHKNQADASDSMQNAMVQIFSKLHQFDPQKGEFKYWSARIVSNESLQLLRKNSKLMSVEVVDDLLDERIEEENNDPVFDSGQLLGFIQKLPSGYRAVFNLYVMEGYSHQEISEILNISVGTSKSQLFKARKMLKGFIVETGQIASL